MPWKGIEKRQKRLHEYHLITSYLNGYAWASVSRAMNTCTQNHLVTFCSVGSHPVFILAAISMYYILNATSVWIKMGAFILGCIWVWHWCIYCLSDTRGIWTLVWYFYCSPYMKKMLRRFTKISCTNHLSTHTEWGFRKGSLFAASQKDAAAIPNHNIGYSRSHILL